ncbi:cytidylate kinase-like family protein [Caproiciproducens sp. CPB-2]|uniref:cytidylate kinase-like family protein n=1 Tax=unclassified Caproiciproducens TaxID=2643836 RepID=UPI0023DA0092|nr:cytidylate kinase-like family protein [Caproiciproducens sp. CPB-2]MDF1495330.1 cytidylate kinase-like family protein [Caproiciproducens sp. CPB-2]
MRNYVITIARGFGSGGKDIATMLSQDLGIPVYEKQILQMASEVSGIAEGLFYDVDEKLKGSYLTNMLKKVPFSTVAEPSEKDFISDVNLFNIQAEIIRNLANTESCVIIGKCADYLLRNYENVISVYVEAPRADCVKSIMSKLRVDEDEANQMIHRTDKYRAEYYKYYTGGGNWTNPINYDMTLNSARIGRKKCVELIKDYIKIKLDTKEEQGVQS